MRFPIIVSAMLIAAAIRPDMQYGTVLSVVLVLFMAKASVMDSIEFYKKVLK